MHICLRDTIFDMISGIFEEYSIEGYVIGGYVRDCILKRNNTKKDIDIVVVGDGILAARKVASILKPGLNVATIPNSHLFLEFYFSISNQNGSQIYVAIVKKLRKKRTSRYAHVFF